MSGTAVCPTCGASVGQGARFCATCGTPLTEAAAEERKLATILFADIVGSTDLGEQLDPERLRALLQEYFAAMSAVVDAWGGTIEKYIGDAILAVWGVPTAREDDPVRALHAALNMHTELERINPDLEQHHSVRIELRIGVNTGEVLAPVGARPAGQFLVSGDAVNVAARLEQAAEPGAILVGERTWTLARAAFAFDDPTGLALKGKRAAVVARRLRLPIDDAAGAAGARPLHARMLGRERELRTLLGLLDETVEEGAPRLVLVAGGAGIGKSRMLRELIEAAQQQRPDLAVLRGRCLATGHGITFWALGEILRQVCAISLDERAESAAEKLERRVAGPLAAVGLGADEIGRTAAALATSANLTLARDPLRGLGPEELAEEMAQAWSRLLTGLARTQPIALVIEDIHWADEPMLRMLESITTRARGPLLVVATARPEFLETHAGFGSAADLSVVSLRPLTDVQSAELIVELLGSAQLPTGLIEDVQRKADGNPFFLEEIIQRLIDEGALKMSDDGWLATERASSVQLPDTIWALLAARIDALPADEKRLLQEAAVVGRIFWPGALGAETAHEEVLRRAEHRGLISLRPTSTIANEREYIFRHVLIRDVAYNSVPRKRRALAHADTARWIDALAADRLDEFAELIAYHYSAAVTGDDADLGWAGDNEGREAARRRALETLIRAGSSARRRYAVVKALALHGQAIELATTDTERAMVHEELGDDHEALYHGDDAVREYLAAIDLVERRAPAHRVAEDAAGAVSEAAETRGRLAGKAGRMVLRWGTFHDKQPIDTVQELVTESLRDPTSERTRAILLMINGGLLRGDNGTPIGAGGTVAPRTAPATIEARVESIESGLEIVRRLDDPELEYLGTELLYVAYHLMRDYANVRRVAEEQGQLLDRLVSVRQQVDSLISLASVRVDGGTFPDALVAGEEAFRRSTVLNAHERMHAAFGLLEAAEPLGAWDRVAQLLPWFAHAAAAEGDITCVSVRGGPPLAATVLARRGQVDEALALVPVLEARPAAGTFAAAAHNANYASLVASADLAHTLTDWALAQAKNGYLELGVVPMIEALTRLEMFDELEQFISAAQSAAESAVAIAATVIRGRGSLAHARGDRASATLLLRTALERFEELGLPFETAQTQHMLAAVLEDPDRDELLRLALAGYEGLGAVPFVERVRAELSTQDVAV